MVAAEIDRESPRSESGAGSESVPRRVKWDDTVRIIREFSGVKPTDRVLDVACGDGILAFEIARHCAYLTGVDVSEGMIALASERAIEAGANNVSFQVGDAANLELPDGTFDRVFCRLGVHHFSDPAKALQEMVRVVKTLGHLIIADIISSEDPSWREAHNRIEHSRDPSHQGMLSPRQIRALLEGAGLSLENVTHWQTRRRFTEWMRLVDADKSMIERTHRLMQEAAKKKSTDLDIAISGNSIEFTHRWMACLALKLN
jgi:SAM-dependent methyltransferase